MKIILKTVIKDTAKKAASRSVQKNLRKKGVGNYVKEILTKAIEKKDGFSIEKKQ